MKCSERGDVARARLCLSKAIRADPNDIALRVLHASLYAKLGDCQRAAESYEQISRICPEDVEVRKISAKVYYQLLHFNIYSFSYACYAINFIGLLPFNLLS